MDANLEKQQELDAEIARLQLELLELKCARNELSPISQLPTDILAIIFSFSLSTQSLRQGWGKGRLPDYVELGHVSRSWRDIAMNTSNLWTFMQIRANTKKELLDSQIINSKHAPLTLEYYGQALNSSPDLDYHSAIIRSVARNRLKSLKVVARGQDVVKVLEGTDSCAEELEELVICDLMADRSYGGGRLQEYIFAGQTPKLRRLELSHYILPWTSSILTSPNLTDLQMGSLFHIGSCSMDKRYILQFLNFLRQATQLKTLTLHICGSDLDQVEAGDVAGRDPVELPRLESLRMATTEPRPLIVLVPLLRLDAKVKCVQLSTMTVSTMSEIHAMLSGLKRASYHLKAPQRVRLSHCPNLRSDGKPIGVVMKGWRTPQASISPGVHPDAGSVIDPVSWVQFKATPFSLRRSTSLNRFPLDNPANVDLEWWFSYVRTLIIDSVDITLAFWTMLSTRLQTLSVVFPAGREDVHLPFYDTLGGKDMNTGGNHGVPVVIPFPALRALHFDYQHIDDRDTQQAIATSILDSLKRRKSAFTGQVSDRHLMDLEDIFFVNCATEVEREVLADFLDVTEKVAWREKARKDAGASMP